MQHSDNKVLVEVVGAFKTNLQDTPYYVKLVDSSRRYLSIHVGEFEAWTISGSLSTALHSQTLFDFTADLLAGARVNVVDVLISATNTGNYIATTTIENDRFLRGVQSRPSDAISLAVRSKAPIWVNEAVMARFGRFEDSLLLPQNTYSVDTLSELRKTKNGLVDKAQLLLTGFGICACLILGLPLLLHNMDLHFGEPVSAILLMAVGIMLIIGFRYWQLRK